MAVAELRYVALKQLPVQVDGELLTLEPGDEIPNPSEWGRALDANIEAGRIAVLATEVLPSGDGRGRGAPSAAAASALSDDELLAEVDRRGYTRPRRRAKAA